MSTSGIYAVRTWTRPFRQLARSPTFTITATASLALGIGASLAMFVLVDAILLRQVPLRNPDRLVRIASDPGPAGEPGPLLSSMVDLIQAEGLFDGMCGFLSPLLTVSIDGRVEQMAAHAMTGPCFRTLGIQTILGRPLEDADDRPGAAKVLVVAYDTWLRDFARDPSVVGRTMVVANDTFTIVGVAKPGFTGLMLGYPEKFFIPFIDFGLGTATTPRGQMPMEVYARLPPHSSQARITNRLRVLWPTLLQASIPARYEGARKDRYLNLRVKVIDGSRGIDYSLRPRFQRALLALLGLSALLLLVTCVNVAGLLLTRAAQRRRDTVVRAALGASRLRLLFEASVESAVLLIASASAGLVLSMWIDRSLVAVFRMTAATFALNMAPDARVIGFACLVCAVAFLMFAIVPTFAASHADVSALASASPRIEGGPSRLRKATVVLQVALTVVLVAVGSVFVSELRSLESEPLGFTPDRVFAAQLVPVPGGYQPPFSGAAYYPLLLRKIAALPGVASVAFSHTPVLARSLGFTSVRPIRSSHDVSVESMTVTSGFFSTLGIPVVSGVTFSLTTRPTTRRQVIVSEAAARALFGGAQVIGERIRARNSLNQDLEIIGVVGDAVVSSPQRRNVRVVYLDFWQSERAGQEWPYLLVRTTSEPASLAEGIRRAVEGAGHEFVSGIRSLRQQRDVSLSQERLIALLSTLFALVGLTLAAVGLYGLLSSSVSQRTREFGIRVALGADRAQIRSLVLRDAVLMLACGLALGTPVAWALKQVAVKALYGHPSISPVPIAAAVGFVLVTGGLAVLPPARRAASLDPTQALHRD